ncbi:MAG TPA: zinc ribbon domain-containing protein [Solirubrobacteraceae bacterium]|nr:zinc ribbon domain-containing protein [Solirubrobacteraceae bacterium]
MPLYDFRCRSCGERFEARTRSDELATCPACGAPAAERQMSGFAGPFTVGLRGSEARRSDARRRDREATRQEQRARRQDERAQRGEPPRPPGPGARPGTGP